MKKMQPCAGWLFWRRAPLEAAATFRRRAERGDLLISRMSRLAQHDAEFAANQTLLLFRGCRLDQGIELLDRLIVLA